jgi:hypothetical protein
LRAFKVSGVGLGVALVISTVILGPIVLGAWFYVLWAAGALFVLNLLFADWAARRISTSRAKALVGGALYAWFNVIATTISAGFVSIVLYAHNLNSLSDWFLLPLFWVGVIGVIPATILGAIFGELTWRSRA